MVRRLIEHTFDPTRQVFARKGFTANGRRYAAGDKLDWRKVAVDQRRVAQMFVTGFLTHEGVEPVSAPSGVVHEPKKQEVTEEPVVGDDLDEIEDMKELRKIADEIGAGYKVSKADQRKAIRAKREELKDE